MRKPTKPIQPVPASTTTVLHVGDGVSRNLPRWFVAVFALLYVSGYLIEFLYYAGIGIVDASGDIFKLKYIQTGVQFLLFLIIIDIPLFILVERDRMNQPINGIPNGDEIYMTPSIIMMAISYFLGIYFAVLFAPIQYFNYQEVVEDWALRWKHWLAVFIFVFFTLTTFIVFSKVLEHSYKRDKKREEGKRGPSNEWSEEQKEYLQKKQARHNWAKDVLARVLIFGMVVLGGFIFWDMRGDLMEMMYPRGIFFFGFAMLLTVIAVRILGHLERVQKDKDEHATFRYAGYVAIGVVGFGAIFFLTITSYAYAIFPFIPNMKGGGDYVAARKVYVTLDKEIEFNVEGYDSSKKQLTNVIIMYATASSYYFAWTGGKGNGPADWRARRKLPIIVQVPRANVRSIVFGDAK